MNWEALFLWVEKYPETAALIVMIGWPLFTGAASFGYHHLAFRLPGLIGFLRAAGLDAPRAGRAILLMVRSRWPKRLPPLPPEVLLLAVLAVGLSACGSPLLATAADVANAGALTGETAAPLVTEFCVEPMKAALVSHDVGAARSIATRCDVPVDAYDTLRVVHVALRAAIVALASGRMPSDLPALIVQMVDASAKLASSIGGLR